MTPDATFWRGRRVLVTGHTGFKGSWLSALLVSMGADVTGLALEPLPGGIHVRIGIDRQLRSVRVDIRDRDDTRDAILESAPEVVLHLAGQALVGHGYADPVGTFSTNVLGTAHVLDAIRNCSSVRAVVVVTSDKVYKNDGSMRAFREDDSLGGDDPYSASKAACEMVVRAWQPLLVERGVRVGAARSGNVIGGGDVAEGRLLPDVFRALRGDGIVRLRNPASTRPWQFVLDPLFGYLELAEHLAAADHAVPVALNFGPDPASVTTVADVVERAFAILGGGRWAPTSERLGTEAKTLSLDAALAKATLGWRPVLDLETALRWTCEWFRAEEAGDDCAALCATQIARYVELAAQ